MNIFANMLTGFSIAVMPLNLIIKNNPNVFWGTIASMYIGNIMLLILNLPLVMAYILCPFLEEAFRQSLIKSHGDFSIFFKRPISATILAFAFLFIVTNVFTGVKDRRKKFLEKIE